jgi:hypothetical protein
MKPSIPVVGNIVNYERRRPPSRCRDGSLVACARAETKGGSEGRWPAFPADFLRRSGK